MAWVQEVTNIFNNTISALTVTIPAGGIPAGHSLVLGIVLGKSPMPTITVSDDAGNIWTLDQSDIVNSATTVAMAHTVVTAPLSAGQNITATWGSTATKGIIFLEEFNDVIYALDQQAIAHGSGTTSLSSGNTATTTSANELVIGVFGWQTTSATLTPGSGFTAGSTLVTTNGSGDKAGAMEWKYVTSTGAQAATGTLTATSFFVAAVQTYSIIPPAGMHNNFESGSNGTTITTGNSGSTTSNAFDYTLPGSGTLAYTNAQAAHGSLAGQFTTSSNANAVAGWTSSMPSLHTVFGRANVYITGSPSVNMRFFQTMNGGPGSGNIPMCIGINTSGQLRIYDGSGTVYSISTMTLPTNQWFRVEWAIYNSLTDTHTVAMIYSTADSTTAAEVNVSTSNTSSYNYADAYLFGNISSNPYSYTIYLDDIAVSNSGFIGPGVSVPSLGAGWAKA